MIFHVVYICGNKFLSFCHNVFGRWTDRQMDNRKAFAILCTALYAVARKDKMLSYRRETALQGAFCYCHK